MRQKVELKGQQGVTCALAGGSWQQHAQRPGSQKLGVQIKNPGIMGTEDVPAGVMAWTHDDEAIRRKPRFIARELETEPHDNVPLGPKARFQLKQTFLSRVARQDIRELPPHSPGGPSDAQDART